VRPGSGVPRVLRIVNDGPQVVRGFELRVNDGPVRSREDVVRLLSLDRPGLDPLGLLLEWSARQEHGAAPPRAGANPEANLAWLGYSLCGESALAMGDLALGLGWRVRPAPLNGHAAMEFAVGTDWHYLDADREVWCPRWEDGQPASVAEILADPLLAMRVRVGGPRAHYRARRSWLNGSLFERVERRSLPELQARTQGEQRRLSGGWDLWPGESLACHYDQPPQRILGADPEGADNAARPRLCTVELQIDARARGAGSEGIAVRAPLPTVAIRYADGSLHPVADDGYRRLVIPSEPVPVAVLFQSTRAGFGELSADENRFRWVDPEGNKASRLRLEWESGPAPAAAPGAPAVVARDAGAERGSAPFGVASVSPDIQEIHWMVSSSPDGPPLAPNLEGIGPVADGIRWDLWADTFLPVAKPAYARVRAGASGAWSAWSPPFVIACERPPLPHPVRVGIEPNGGLRFEWTGGAADAEALLFGSDRMDFVPEIFGIGAVEGDSGVRAAGDAVERNLLARGNGNVLRVSGPQAGFHYYRLVWGDGTRGRTLSPLLRGPRPAGDSVPRVLQTRHAREPDASPLGYRDRYEATLMAVPMDGR
jgi:hypothetical protein